MMISKDIWERLNVLEHYLKSKGTSLDNELKKEDNFVDELSSVYIDGVTLEAMELVIMRGNEWAKSYYIPRTEDNEDFKRYMLEHKEEDVNFQRIPWKSGKLYYVIEREYGA